MAVFSTRNGNSKYTLLTIYAAWHYRRNARSVAEGYGAYRWFSQGL